MIATDTLWTLANSAVLRGHWDSARVLLDDLAHRDDYADEIVTPRGAPQHVADRIDAVNLRARLNRGA